MVSGRTDEEFHVERAASLESILRSNEPRKVVLAGPGTGKTFTFKQLLKDTEPPTLVISFIRNLVTDLDRALGEFADVRTFHGFARWMLHSKGVIAGVHYYPFLPEVIRSDIHWIGPDVSFDAIEDAVRTLDETNPKLGVADRSVNYYRAVGHDLAVLSVLRHFRDNEADIPTYNQVVVDEYQDFNSLEVALIEQLAKKSPVLVAGDDDQALYSFKLASPEFLRELHRGGIWVPFTLPFCSRCPAVVVEATHRLVSQAQSRGLLLDRIDKPFECFMPTKREVSEGYPRILHARCSVHMKKAPYMARYIEEWVRGLPDEDVRDSIDDSNPTVLVIGPGYVTGPIYDYLELLFPDVIMKTRPDSGLTILDGYELLLRDPRSRLGWRIVTMVDIPPDMTSLLRQALEGSAELADILPGDFRGRHLEVVALMERLRKRGDLTDEERSHLEARTGVPIAELLPEPDDEEAIESEVHEEVEDGPPVPSIVLTGSLVASKGLQAEHVFIVGLHGGDLPRNPGAPTDDDVCQLLVALTRAKKSCHIVTTDRLFGVRKERSALIDWLGDLVQETYVNKEYFAD